MKESKSRVSFASSLGTFESFKRRNYRYLWLGTYSAAFGVWLHQASLGWFVFEITNSPFLVGVVVATRNVPFVISGLGGGKAAEEAETEEEEEPVNEPGNQAVIDKLDELISAVQAGGIINMDGKKVGDVIGLAATPRRT